MRIIFLDVSCQHLKLLSKIAKKVRRITNRYSDIKVVLFGLHHLPVNVRRNILQALSFKNNIDICSTVGTIGGIEVQEWLNHYTHPVHSICVISNQLDLRPVQNHVISLRLFFIRWKIFKMLRRPYVNQMAKQIKDNQRLLF